MAATETNDKGSGDWECYGCGHLIESLTKGFNTQCPQCGSYELHLSDAAKARMRAPQNEKGRPSRNEKGRRGSEKVSTTERGKH